MRNIPKPKTPMFIYYLSKNSTYNEVIDEEAEKEKYIKEMTDYHHNYGQYGFLSEKTSLENILEKARRHVEMKRRDVDISYNLGKCDIYPENYIEQIKQIENQEDFVCWYRSLEEQIKE